MGKKVPRGGRDEKDNHKNKLKATLNTTQQQFKHKQTKKTKKITQVQHQKNVKQVQEEVVVVEKETVTKGNVKTDIKVDQGSKPFPTSNWLKLLPLKGKAKAKKIEENEGEEEENLGEPKNVLEANPELPGKKNLDKILIKDDGKIGKFVAVDCEMVGVGEDGVESALARVSIVNFHGHLVLDKFVKPNEKVTDFRTHVSGIRPVDILRNPNAVSLKEIQQECAKIFENRIVVGHAIQNDFKVLFFNLHKNQIRDTSRYKPYRKLANGRNPSLKMLAKNVLGLEIQKGEHSSVDDAKVTMLLYRHSKDEWERKLMKKKQKKPGKKKEKTINDHDNDSDSE